MTNEELMLASLDREWRPTLIVMYQAEKIKGALVKKDMVYQALRRLENKGLAESKRSVSGKHSVIYWRRANA